VKEDKLASPKTQVNSVIIDNVINSDIPGQGYFKSSFDQQIKKSPTTKNETVTAGIFKTANGWKDGKYYLLIDGVQPGTILKITNPLIIKQYMQRCLVRWVVYVLTRLGYSHQ
jgi:hypothetical protein